MPPSLHSAQRGSPGPAPEANRGVDLGVSGASSAVAPAPQQASVRNGASPAESAVPVETHGTHARTSTAPFQDMLSYVAILGRLEESGDAAAIVAARRAARRPRVRHYEAVMVLGVNHRGDSAIIGSVRAIRRPRTSAGSIAEEHPPYIHFLNRRAQQIGPLPRHSNRSAARVYGALRVQFSAREESRPLRDFTGRRSTHRGGLENGSDRERVPNPRDRR